MTFIKALKTATLISFLMVSTLCRASDAVPLIGGEIKPGGKLIISLASLNKNIDYDVYCNISDTTKTSHNALISIIMFEIFIKKLLINGKYSERGSDWYENLPAKKNALAFTFVKHADKVGYVEFRNIDPENTIFVSDCKAYLTN